MIIATTDAGRQREVCAIRRRLDAKLEDDIATIDRPFVRMPCMAHLDVIAAAGFQRLVIVRGMQNLVPVLETPLVRHASMHSSDAKATASRDYKLQNERHCSNFCSARDAALTLPGFDLRDLWSAAHCMWAGDEAVTCRDRRHEPPTQFDGEGSETAPKGRKVHAQRVVMDVSDVGCDAGLNDAVGAIVPAAAAQRADPRVGVPAAPTCVQAHVGPEGIPRPPLSQQPQPPWLIKAFEDGIS
eukprot:5703760-Prymnesium_polylepis.2